MPTLCRHAGKRTAVAMEVEDEDAPPPKKRRKCNSASEENNMETTPLADSESKHSKANGDTTSLAVKKKGKKLKNKKQRQDTDIKSEGKIER